MIGELVCLSVLTSKSGRIESFNELTEKPKLIKYLLNCICVLY